MFTTFKSIESLKITDFGIAPIFDPKLMAHSLTGTALFKAPETMQKEPSKKSDIWSLGVILYILLCGHPPFNGKNDLEMLECIQKLHLTFDDPSYTNITDEAKDLISKMLIVDPDKRISAYAALNHKWVIMHQNRNSILYKPMSIFAAGRLRFFEADAKIQQAATAFIITKLVSEKDKSTLQKLFKDIDKNGDGQLSIDEVSEGCRKLFGEQLDKETIKQIFDKVDMDHSGTIDFQEFLVATIDRNQALSEKNLRDAFDLLDKGKKGYLSTDEIRDLVQTDQFLKQEQWMKVVKESDTNGDGYISFDEFMSIMKGKH